MPTGPGSLPPKARARLTAPLRARIPAPAELRDSARSIPLLRQLWEARLAGLRVILVRLDAALDPSRYQSDSWADLSDALGTLASARHELVAMLVALARIRSSCSAHPEKREQRGRDGTTQGMRRRHRRCSRRRRRWRDSPTTGHANVFARRPNPDHRPISAGGSVGNDLCDEHGPCGWQRCIQRGKGLRGVQVQQLASTRISPCAHAFSRGRACGGHACHGVDFRLDRVSS